MGNTQNTKTNTPSECCEVSVCLKDIIGILEDAVANRRAFLEDFHQDRVTVSRDLFEVLVAYRRYQPEFEAA